MNALPRRRFLRVVAATSLMPSLLPAVRSLAADPRHRQFTLDLSPGSIGVGGNLLDHLRLAKSHGFESVQPDTGFLVAQDEAGVARIRDALAASGLKWGSGGVPVDFRQSEDAFQRGLADLPKSARALQRAGVSRVGTWLMPGHQELEFAANQELHARRLGAIARVLRDHGLRFGLEYVGTPSLAARFKHPFVRRLAETRALIAAIGASNVGVILDSWHWWTAGDSTEAIRALRADDIVSVDLNDAPAGVALAEQQDGRRELPLATGVIPLKEFLSALVATGFDGPARAEPFNKPLNDLDDEAACQRTIAALRAAAKLVG